MHMDNFKKTIALETTANSIYEALTNAIDKWWTEMLEGISNQQGQIFTIRFGPNVFKTMLVEELVPGEKVIWRVTDSLIDIPELKNKTEWIDTRIVWEIFSADNKTVLHLTHFGLTPQIECYNICEMGWYQFTDSLKSFIETGKGNPFRLS